MFTLMMIVSSIVALFCCLQCLGTAVLKSTHKFEKVLFSLMSVLFLVICVTIQVGVWG